MPQASNTFSPGMIELGPGLRNLSIFIPDPELEPNWSPGEEGRGNTSFSCEVYSQAVHSGSFMPDKLYTHL